MRSRGLIIRSHTFRNVLMETLTEIFHIMRRVPGLRGGCSAGGMVIIIIKLGINRLNIDCVLQYCEL